VITTASARRALPCLAMLLFKKREIALDPGLDACPANGAIVAAPVIRARTAHELQGLLSGRDRFAAWRNRPMLCRKRELMMQGAAGIKCLQM
jgi:hypothetical protein